MSKSIEGKISRAEKTADFFEKKGNQFWAKAKNGGDEFYYKQARDCYDRAKMCMNSLSCLKHGTTNITKSRKAVTRPTMIREIW